MATYTVQISQKKLDVKPPFPVDGVARGDEIEFTYDVSTAAKTVTIARTSTQKKLFDVDSFEATTSPVVKKTVQGDAHDDYCIQIPDEYMGVGTMTAKIKVVSVK